MLTEERHQYILKKLNEFGIVKSQELQKELDCSESTIRRDLVVLEKKGLLKRIHGGAKRIYSIEEELSMNEKSLKNIHEKNSIGELAATLVNDNDVIFIDAGTTTQAMIPFLTDKKNISVVTNGVQQASLLADLEINTFIVGGNIKVTTKAIIGANAINELKNYSFNKAFIGMNGIDLEFGLTTPDPEEASLKKTAIKQSAISYCLVDHSKWDKINFAKVCDLDEVTIITDKLPADLLNKYSKITRIMEAVK